MANRDKGFNKRHNDITFKIAKKYQKKLQKKQNDIYGAILIMVTFIRLILRKECQALIKIHQQFRRGFE